MLSLIGGLVAIILGLCGLFAPWYGSSGWAFLAKGLIAVVTITLVFGGGVAVGAGIGAMKDKMKSKEEEKKEEEKKEEKQENKEEKKEEKKE